jgi:predicted dehydrogenase
MGRRHAENVSRQVSEARLIGVADADRATSERVAHELGTKSYESVDALVGSTDLRAVIVASPRRFHAEHAFAAMRAGKDVFVEKPLAASLDDADRLIAAGRTARVRLQVGFQRRYDSAFRDAHRLVSSGELGRPLFYRGVNRDRDAPVGAPGSMETSDILTESAIHDLDGARWMMSDDVAGVTASLGTIGDRETSPAPDLTLVVLRFARGGLAHVEALRGAGYAYDIRSEVVCERGAVMVGGFARTILAVLRPGERRDGLYPGFLERYADAYVEELRDFIGGVRERRPPAVTGEDGRIALAIAFAASRSAATSEEVAIS